MRTDRPGINQIMKYIVLAAVSYTHLDVYKRQEFGQSSVCFGTINGGYNTNVVAEKCSITIDMRLAPPLTTEGSLKLVEDAIQEACEKVPGLKGSYNVIAKRPYILQDDSSVLLRELQEAVSYTHLDVYKRQYVHLIHDIPLDCCHAVRRIRTYQQKNR